MKWSSFSGAITYNRISVIFAGLPKKEWVDFVIHLIKGKPETGKENRQFGRLAKLLDKWKLFGDWAKNLVFRKVPRTERPVCEPDRLDCLFSRPSAENLFFGSNLLLRRRMSEMRSIKILARLAIAGSMGFLAGAPSFRAQPHRADHSSPSTAVAQLLHVADLNW